MDFIKNNYSIFIFVGLFIVFALIGYIIDILRDNNRNTDDSKLRTIIPDEVKSIELDKVIEKEETKSDEETKEELNDEDDLLKNYEDEI